MNLDELKKRIIYDPFCIKIFEPTLEEDAICELVRLNPVALYHLKIQTEKICISALKSQGSALGYIRNKTFTLCVIGVHEDAWSFQYVAAIYEQFSKEELFKICETTLKKNGLLIKLMNQINSPLRLIFTSEDLYQLYKIAVGQDGSALEFIMDNEQTEELCWIAIKHRCIAYKFIATRLKLLEITSYVIQRHGLSIEYVKDPILQESVSWPAIYENYWAYKYVINKTYDMSKYVVEQDGYMLYEVPELQQTLEICKIALTQNYKSLAYVINQTDEICSFAININKGAVRYIKDKTKVAGYVLKYICATNNDDNSKLSEYDTCVICYNDQLPNMCKMKCGHYYHQTCILRIIESSETIRCPLCRVLLF